MTEKRFRYYEEENGEFPSPYIKDSDGKDIISLYQCYECMNALHEENVKLKNSLKEFEVFESNRIKGGVVTNDDFSVTLHSNNEAYMVCNMLNRFIRSVKNGNND